MVIYFYHMRNPFAKKVSKEKEVVVEVDQEIVQNEVVAEAKQETTGTSPSLEEQKGEYKLTLSYNGQELVRYGNNASIFQDIPLGKLTTKTVVKLEKGNKKFEVILAPSIVKRLVINKTVQAIQFKRLSARVD